MLDTQIAKLIGTTKNTVISIKKRTYWNFSNLSPKDPIAINFCTQLDLQKAMDKSNRRIEREKKDKDNLEKQSKTK